MNDEDKEVFATLMYALTKEAAKNSWYDFLEGWGITDLQYKRVRDYLKETYGVETYL